MSNHHLRNKELTLKAKGLLSQMLSLPEDWDYTLAGLSHINRESIDAIRTAVWELEKQPTDLQRAHIKQKKQEAQTQLEEKEQTPEIPAPDPTISAICATYLILLRNESPYGII